MIQKKEKKRKKEKNNFLLPVICLFLYRLYSISLLDFLKQQKGKLG